MAEMTTLGALVATPTGNPFHERVKDIIRAKFPQGWSAWPVSSSIPVDPKPDRNKLRFAIPTVDLCLAYDPDARSISERSFKHLKASLFTWPVGRALIYSPADFALALRPSREDFDAFLESIRPLKPLFLCRESACKVLGNGSPIVVADNDAPSASSEIRAPSYESLSPSRPAVIQVVNQQLKPVTDRLAAFEDRFLEFQASITELLRNPPQSRRSESSVEDYADDISGIGEDEASSPPPTEDPWFPEEEVLDPPRSPDMSDFAAQTIELAPRYPEAPEVLVKDLIRCQSLDSSGWDRIRYVDAENALKHAAPFQPLIANPSLICSNKIAESNLRNFERVLCNLSFGLLAQRDAFQAARKEMVKLNPAAEPLFKKLFTGEQSLFKTTSAHLLQYTCGKRAEVIQERRKLLLPADSAIKRTISAIPPSKTHLFHEESLAKVPTPPAQRARSFGVHQLKRRAAGPSPSGAPPKVPRTNYAPREDKGKPTRTKPSWKSTERIHDRRPRSSRQPFPIKKRS
ncbi:uncharacterized protein LOC113466149 [Diaphorina citri]|uniref:Uncharacterized protein LOC113466149 n=1 Tax=Diaphorina citri TaxID=121845 RepID=A0A3Q0ILG6_DIACI|nr:uncharacterized protein LOC113466149 [Diaphorina citri]